MTVSFIRGGGNIIYAIDISNCILNWQNNALLDFFWACAWIHHRDGDLIHLKFGEDLLLCLCEHQKSPDKTNHHQEVRGHRVSRKPANRPGFDGFQFFFVIMCHALSPVLYGLRRMVLYLLLPRDYFCLFACFGV